MSHRHVGLHHHELAADHWAHLDEPGRDAWQLPHVVVSAGGIAERQVVADVGAGTGYLVAHLSRAVGPEGKVLALDANPHLVQHMNRRFQHAALKNVETRVIQHNDPGLAPASIDRALVVDLWHHLHDRIAYGQKLRAAMRPHGRLLIVDRGSDSSHAPPAEMRINAEAVIDELKAAGFFARLLPTALPRQFMVEGAVLPSTLPESPHARGGTSE